MPVAALVCDLDGVLRIFDEPVAIESSHGLARGSLAAAAFDPVLLDDAVSGAVSDAQWRARIVARLAEAVPVGSAQAAVDAWSASSGSVDADVLALVRWARERVPVVLLTNATTRLRDDLAVLGLDRQVDAVVSSAEVGAAKPDARAYEAVEAAVADLLGAPVPAASLLYVDDTRAHVDTTQMT